MLLCLSYIYIDESLFVVTIIQLEYQDFFLQKLIIVYIYYILYP